MGYITGVNIPAYGAINGTAISGTYQTIFTATFDLVILQIFNTVNEDTIISLDGGTTDHYKLPAGTSFVLDFTANDARLSKPIVQVKKVSATPTSGFMSVTGIHAR